MRRLFSTFAHGAPGGGLLLLRVVAGSTLLFFASAAFRVTLSLGPIVVYLLTGALGILLLLGLWTPISGSLVALVSPFCAFLQRADFLNWFLLGVLGAALALLGPGAWSVDAHLFGWKRVELPDRKS